MADVNPNVYRDITSVINDPMFCLDSLAGYTAGYRYSLMEVISAVLRLVIRLPETEGSKYPVYLVRHLGQWRIEIEQKSRFSPLYRRLRFDGGCMRVSKFLREYAQYFPPRRVIFRSAAGAVSPFAPYILGDNQAAGPADLIPGAQVPRSYDSDEPVEIMSRLNAYYTKNTTVAGIKRHILYSWCAGDRELYRRVMLTMARAVFAPGTRGSIILVRYNRRDRETYAVYDHIIRTFCANYSGDFKIRDLPFTGSVPLYTLVGYSRPLTKSQLPAILGPDGCLPRNLAGDTVTAMHSFTESGFTLPTYANYILCTRERHLPKLHPSVLVLDALPCFVGDPLHGPTNADRDDQANDKKYEGGLFGYLRHLHEKFPLD